MLQKLMAPLGKLTAPLGKLTGGNPLVPGIIACVALAVIVPPMLAGYWIFLVTAGLLTTITAMGLAIIVGWVGEVNLAGAGLLEASVYVTGYFYRVGDSRLNGWPFIPAGDSKRDNAKELELKAKLERELPIEQDLTRWLALFDAPV